MRKALCIMFGKLGYRPTLMCAVLSNSLAFNVMEQFFGCSNNI